MSTLREAAQAAPDAEVRAQHKEFARWFLELSDKSALASEYLAWLAWKAALAHPPRDEWREAVHDELVTTWTLSAENKDDPRKALQDIINWHVRVSLDPAVSSDAQALIERGKAMRDEWRPASVDCRTCRHFAKLDCLSTAMCIDGSQHKPTTPMQMWERTA